MKTPLQRIPHKHSKQQGFSMIEVLVTFLIITLALLGAVGLQAHSIRMNQSGQFRGQAVFLAGDIAERMQANFIAAKAGRYNLSDSSTAPSNSTACETESCDATALASYDKAQWQNSVAALLPQSAWSITTAATGNLVASTVTLSWYERPANAPGTSTSTAAVTATYRATRLIFK
jgi:type IV pilus assembly protein PilV